MPLTNGHAKWSFIFPFLLKFTLIRIYPKHEERLLASSDKHFTAPRPNRLEIYIWQNQWLRGQPDLVVTEMLTAMRSRKQGSLISYNQVFIPQQQTESHKRQVAWSTSCPYQQGHDDTSARYLNDLLFGWFWYPSSVDFVSFTNHVRIEQTSHDLCTWMSLDRPTLPDQLIQLQRSDAVSCSKAGRYLGSTCCTTQQCWVYMHMLPDERTRQA